MKTFIRMCREAADDYFFMREMCDCDVCKRFSKAILRSYVYKCLNDHS